MNKEPIIQITGGRRLSGGRVAIAGSSNQVTKCIMAAMLTDEPVLIKGAPEVNERRMVEDLFAALGGQVEYLDEKTVRLTGRTIDKHELSRKLCERNRIAILAAGPLLHRFKK